MNLITLSQAAALVVLTVLGAYAAGDPTRTAAAPACFTETQATCAR